MSKLISLEELSKFVSSQQKYGAYTLGYLIEEGHKLPELKRIWGNYIFEKSIIHFPSFRGSGKSLLMLQLCIAISSNMKNYLGEIIEMNGATVYLDFEMPDFFIKKRSAKLNSDPPFKIGKYAEDVFVFSTKQSFENEFDNIIKLIHQVSPTLVVIDNLRTALKNANTCSSIDMANFFSLIGGIREKYNCAFVIVDHLRKGTKNLKSDSDLQSGSGSKTDLSDGDFMIRHSCQDKSLRLLKRLKSRMFEESDDCKLIRLNPETLWFELVQENVNESEHIGLSIITEKDELLDIAKDLRKKGMSLQQIATALAKPKSTIHRWLGDEPEG